LSNKRFPCRATGSLIDILVRILVRSVEGVVSEFGRRNLRWLIDFFLRGGAVILGGGVVLRGGDGERALYCEETDFEFGGDMVGERGCFEGISHTEMISALEFDGGFGGEFDSV
jgi:hypothetical protein